MRFHFLNLASQFGNVHELKSEINNTAYWWRNFFPTDVFATDVSATDVCPTVVSATTTLVPPKAKNDISATYS